MSLPLRHFGSHTQMTLPMESIIPTLFGTPFHCCYLMRNLIVYLFLRQIIPFAVLIELKVLFAPHGIVLLTNLALDVIPNMLDGIQIG
jgi:hypothetical protein